MERFRLDGCPTQVGEDDLHAAREVRQLTQASAHARVVEALDVLEDVPVGVEGYLATILALRGLANDVQWLHHSAVLEADAVMLAVAPDLRHEPVGEGVNDRAAHAVEAAGHLVGTVVELAAGMELGEDDLDGRAPFPLHGVYRDATAVVADRGGTVRVQGHLDGVGVAREGLVDGVVDDLGEQLVVTVYAGAALHVHGGALTHPLKAPQDLDVLSGVPVAALVLVLIQDLPPGPLGPPTPGSGRWSAAARSRPSSPSILPRGRASGQTKLTVLDGISA